MIIKRTEKHRTQTIGMKHRLEAWLAGANLCQAGNVSVSLFFVSAGKPGQTGGERDVLTLGAGGGGEKEHGEEKDCYQASPTGHIYTNRLQSSSCLKLCLQ